jgi:hypothetical protein
MIGDACAWGPVLWALHHPGYFYPVLLIGFLISAIAWFLVPYGVASSG